MHTHVKSRFLDWRDGKADRAEIDGHLGECPSCRLYFERMTRLLDPAVADGLPKLLPDPYLPGRIAVLAAERGRTRAGEHDPSRHLLRSAAYFAAVVIGVFIGMTIAPEPPEEDLDEIVSLYNQSISGEDFSSQLDAVLEESGGESE